MKTKTREKLLETPSVATFILVLPKPHEQDLSMFSSIENEEIVCS